MERAVFEAFFIYSLENEFRNEFSDNRMVNMAFLITTVFGCLLSNVAVSISAIERLSTIIQRM